MSKARKYNQHRSKGERLNWEPVLKDSGKFVARDAMSGRFLSPVQVRDHDLQTVRSSKAKQLVPWILSKNTPIFHDNEIEKFKEND